MREAQRMAFRGMISMIRQACNAMEAYVALDDEALKPDRATDSIPDPERYLSDKEEAMIGEMLGLTDDVSVSES